MIRFISQVAAFLGPLNNFLKGIMKNSVKTPDWKESADPAVQAVMLWRMFLTCLAYWVVHARTMLSTCASAEAVGAVLQQKMAVEVKLVPFFSKRLELPNPFTIPSTGSSWRCTNMRVTSVTCWRAVSLTGPQITNCCLTPWLKQATTLPPECVDKKKPSSSITHSSVTTLPTYSPHFV